MENSAFVSFDQKLKEYMKVQEGLKANVKANNEYAEKLVADAQGAINSVSAASAGGGGMSGL